jgi:hypothetical protein
MISSGSRVTTTASAGSPAEGTCLVGRMLRSFPLHQNLQCRIMSVEKLMVILKSQSKQGAPSFPGKPFLDVLKNCAMTCLERCVLSPGRLA